VLNTPAMESPSTPSGLMGVFSAMIFLRGTCDRFSRDFDPQEMGTCEKRGFRRRYWEEDMGASMAQVNMWVRSKML
jgi:hypothetical protein